MARQIHTALGMARCKKEEKVTTEIDIYRAANILIRDHGEDAVIEAALRVDKMMEEGDLDGRATWRRILTAIEKLLSKECPEDASVH